MLAQGQASTDWMQLDTYIIKITKNQYSPVQLLQARLVSSALYGTLAMLASFKKKNKKAWRCWNGLYDKANPTKKEPIIMFDLPQDYLGM